MTPLRLLRAAVLLAGLALLPGCSAVSALSGASAPLDAYTLTPVVPAGTLTRVERHLIVELPTASGAIDTDRILFKPNRLQAQYLPDGRWVNPAPDLVQTMLVQSLQNTGALRLVGRQALGLQPDYTLMTELIALQAEPGPPGGAPFTARVAVSVTIVRESDRRIVGTRRIEQVAGAASNDTLALVSAMDTAMAAALREAVGWTLAQMGVRGAV